MNDAAIELAFRRLHALGFVDARGVTGRGIVAAACLISMMAETGLISDDLTTDLAASFDAGLWLSAEAGEDVSLRSPRRCRRPPSR